LTEDDWKLQHALEHWHKEKTVEIFGRAILVDMGPSLAMPSEILDQIVECVHLKVIKTVGQLVHETCWNDGNQYGKSISVLFKLCGQIYSP
ncbi:hypothetical protein BDQ17DRAFT_1185481, partial [Cyathus striatus]